MCSNTSSTSGAGFSGDDGDYATHILKKSKRQRVPKRGPGVAELEKILREQESKVISSDKGNVPFVPNHHDINHLISPAPQMTMLYGNVDGRGNGGSNGVRIGAGSGIILPEEVLLPTVWNSCESSIYEEVHNRMLVGYPISTSFINGADQMHDMLQKKQYPHDRYPSPTVNLFPQYGSSLPSPENQSAVGFYVHIEPPSNQKSSHHNYSSMFPEEEKMATTKRPRTFSKENTSGSAAPKFHGQASSPYAHMQMPDQSLSFSNGVNIQRHETLSGGSYGAMNGNFLIFGSPATPSSLMTPNHQRSLPFQESSMDGSDSHSQQKKNPFNSFLVAKEQTGGEEETTLGLNNETAIRRDTIDLNLKL